MTRQEFIEDVNSFCDLFNFCSEEGIDGIFDDIYDAEYLNDILMETISNMRDWEEVRGLLANIPTRCDYYREDGYGGYEDADYSFDDYKNEVLRYMDANGTWDEDEEDTEDNIEVDVDEDTDGWFAPADIEEDIETNSFMAVLGRAS